MPRSRSLIPALTILLALAGCDSATSPVTAPLFSNDIPFSDFQHQAAAGPTRP